MKFKKSIRSLLRPIVARPFRILIVLGLLLVAVGVINLAIWHWTPLPEETLIDRVLNTSSKSSGFLAVGTYIIITGKTVPDSIVKYFFSGDRVVSFYVVASPAKGSPVHVPVLVGKDIQHGAPEGQFTYEGRIRELEDKVAAQYRKRGFAFRRPVYLDTIHVPKPLKSIPWLVLGIALISAALKWKQKLKSLGVSAASILFSK